jgi:nucleoside-diphosphate-sugar epimerase
MPSLFVFGLGFSGLTLANKLLAKGWEVAGTCRTAEKAAMLRKQGIETFVFDGSSPLSADALAGTTHILASAPSDPDDPVLRCNAKDIAALNTLEWVGYLSTTSVYGVTDGSAVDEDTPCTPTSARGQRRLTAEAAWQSLPVPAHIFRLSGIYGPGSSVFDTIKAGRAQRIVKPGQAFNRIHVADIAQTVAASIENPASGRIYNLADDLPAPSADLVTYACGLMRIDPPPEIPFQQAVLSPMGREFWADNKRVSNTRIRRELGVRLIYPTYREGLDAIFRQERA